MIGYTCVCVCVCVCCVGWPLFCSVLCHVQHITLLLPVGRNVKELSVVSALYTVRTALHTLTVAGGTRAVQSANASFPVWVEHIAGADINKFTRCNIFTAGEVVYKCDCWLDGSGTRLRGRRFNQQWSFFSWHMSMSRRMKCLSTCVTVTLVQVRHVSDYGDQFSGALFQNIYNTSFETFCFRYSSKYLLDSIM